MDRADLKFRLATKYQKMFTSHPDYENRQDEPKDIMNYIYNDTIYTRGQVPKYNQI